jgi:hypothetical protein
MRMPDYRAKIENMIDRIVAEVKNIEAVDTDDALLDALDTVISANDSEIFIIIEDEVCRRLGKENPF